MRYLREDSGALRRWAALVLFAASALISGCGSYNPFRKVTETARVSPVVGRSDTVAKNGAGGLGIEPGSHVDDLRLQYAYPVNLDTFMLPGDETPAYDLARDDPDYRNRLQDYVERISDDVCNQHKGDILAVASSWNGGLGGLTTILGGLGAIFTGATTTRVLAGSAGITNAIRSDINENVFYNNFATAIVRQIDAQRKQKLLEIIPRRNSTTDDYSVDAALRDIAEYHNLCSFYEAVAALATDTRRPATADELKGRIEALRDQADKNSKRITELQATPNAVETTQLQNANALIARMLASLTMQLGLVQGAPAPAK